MSCADNITKIQLLLGLNCVKSSDDPSSCCTSFEAVEGCTAPIYEVFDSETSCLEFFEMFNSSGTCYLGLGVLEDAVCGSTTMKDPTTAIPSGTTVPEHSWAFLSLMLAAIILLVLFVTHHIRTRVNLKYQSIYVLLMTSLFLTMPLSLVSVYAPVSAPIVDVLIVMVEGYLAYTFGGLLVAWGFEHGDVPEAMMDCPIGSRPFSFLCLTFGPQFKCGHVALKNWERCVGQLFFIKTLTQLVLLSSSYANDTTSLSTPLTLATGFINLISILVMLKGLRVLYLCLKRKEIVDGMRVIQKFAVVKLFFSAIVINNILISPLLSHGVFDPPAWVCLDKDGTSVYSSECDQRFLVFIFLCEALLLLLWGMFAYSANDFDKETAQPFSAQNLLTQTVRSLNTSRLWSLDQDELASKTCLRCGIHQDSQDEITGGSKRSKSINNNNNNTLSKDEEPQSLDDILREVSVQYRPKIEKYMVLTKIFGWSAFIFLTLGLIVPLWYSADLDGCKISISYVTSSWCHGSCPTQGADSLAAALESKESLGQELVYQVCHVQLPNKAWSSAGFFLSLLAPVVTIIGHLFRKKPLLLLASAFGLIGFALLCVKGPVAFNSSLVIINLQQQFGMSQLQIAVAWVLYILGIICSFIAVLLLYRFHLYREKSYQSSLEKVQEGMGDGETTAAVV